MQPQPQEQVPGVLKKLPVKNKETIIISMIAVLVVALGIFTGWNLSGGSTNSSSDLVVPGSKQTAQEAGIDDESAFPDSIEGKLESGGIAGEGTHHLVREGGDSQNVYLTSTVIDLESFVGKDVTVWGQTTSAQKAGWLMDVGKIKVNN